MRAAVRASKGDAFGAGFVPLRYRGQRAARLRLPQFGQIRSRAAASGTLKAASFQNRRSLDRLAKSLQLIESLSTSAAITCADVAEPDWPPDHGGRTPGMRTR